MCDSSHFSLYAVPSHYCLFKLYVTTQSVEPPAGQLLVLIKKPASLYDTKQIVINAAIGLSNSVDIAIRFMVA